MSKYVDGFVLVVPNDKAEAYKQMATEGKEMWMRHGALEYFECIGDDLKAQEMGDMKALSFPELAKSKAGENVWFSFIVFKSKAHRDEVNAKVMAEMGQQQEKYKDTPMPFDMKRMAYGGFSVQVEG